MRAPRRLLDEGSELPCDRACGRRGHPHALGAAQGAARDRRALAACPCAGRRRRGRRRRATAVVIGPGQDAVAAEARRVLPERRMLRAARAARHGACGAGGESRDRAAARRHSHRLRRHAADPAGDAQAVARAAWPPARRSRCWRFGRPIPPATAGSSSPATTRRHSRGGRRQRRRTGDRSLQRRDHGARRRTARSPSWSGSATTIARANFI